MDEYERGEIDGANAAQWRGPHRVQYGSAEYRAGYIAGYNRVYKERTAGVSRYGFSFHIAH